ncbi:MAG: DUF4332 domain-containing protein [Anaerolineae bacterium]|nr:DUF4332 domain-containing protein [Anaerolineae bacterium]MCB0247792.1 DUF4332 domain-containing protein [Anaerolineae bacterium]
MELIGSLIGLGVLAAAPRIPGLRPVVKVVIKTGMAVTEVTVAVAATVAEEVSDLVAHVRPDHAGETARHADVAAETPVVPEWLDNTDFLQIDGIGPKVSAILKDASIETIMQMASTPAERLQEILDAAGPRFGAIDASTWPEQAQALVTGKQV